MSITLSSQSVNIDRLKLLRVLKTNLKKHQAEYAQAVINYRQAIILDLSQALAIAQDTSMNLSSLSVKFAHPVSYADQYQNVIDMLQESEDKIINLDSSAFRAYFKDEWHWKSNFELSNMAYASKAATFGNVGVALSGALTRNEHVGAAVRVGGSLPKVSQPQARKGRVLR